MNLLAYLLKLILASAILYGYYRLFLRNKRFHHYNRFFLLSALLLSIVTPFIRIPILHQPENPVNDALYQTVSVISTDYDEVAIADFGAAPVNESMFTIMNSIYLLYAIGVFFLLTLVVKSLLYIRSLRKRYPAERITSLRFYNTREPGTPFSFFRSIFWNDQLPFNTQEGQQIFRHELFHVQHRHSTDRLLAEIVTAIFWFNPFFHLIKKELKAIHEFLADQFAISGSDRYTYATLLVQQALESGKHRVTNHFFQNHIKRRIAMITQFQQSKYGYWSRVMILPVSLLLFCFITLHAKKPAKNTVSITDKPAIAVGNGPSANETTVVVTDTVPDKAAKEKEELMQKMREAQLEELKKKMTEQELLMKKANQDELEALKKQMHEHELLAVEQEQIRKRQLDEIRLLNRKMQERQQELHREKSRQIEEIKKSLKEYELKESDKPEERKKKEEILDEFRKKVEQAQHEMRARQEQEEDMIKSKMRELESKSQHQDLEQRSRRIELQNLKQKLIQQEKDIKNQ